MNRPRYNEEFKIESVKQVLERGHRVAEVANWIDGYDAAIFISVIYKFSLFKAINQYYGEKNTRFESEKTDRCQARRRS